MRIVVVGGGIIGLLTAMECVRAGACVSLVDRSAIPSSLATSNDTQRVVRALHRCDAELTRAAARAEQGWLTVEDRLGLRIFHRTGALTAMPATEIPTSLALLAAAGAPSRTLTAGQLAAGYPQIRFPPGLAAVLEPTAGVVLARVALTALARWLGSQPAVRIHPRNAAVAVDDTGTVRLADGDVLAGDRVIVAAGPWSRDLLPAAMTENLTLYRQSMLTYAPSPFCREWAGTPAIPALGTAQGAWLIPPVGGAPVRLSAASACREVPEMTGHLTPVRWRVHLADQFAALLADFDPAAVIAASDAYYLAHDGQPLLAMSRNEVLLAYAACGGMSFKFAPLIARALACRAVGRPRHPTGLDPVDRPRLPAEV